MRYLRKYNEKVSSGMISRNPDENINNHGIVVSSIKPGDKVKIVIPEYEFDREYNNKWVTVKNKVGDSWWLRIKELKFEHHYDNIIQHIPKEDWHDDYVELGLLESVNVDNIKVGDYIKVIFTENVLYHNPDIKKYNNKWVKVCKIDDRSDIYFDIDSEGNFLAYPDEIIKHIPEELWHEGINDMEELGLLESNQHGIDITKIKPGDKVFIVIPKEKLSIDNTFESFNSVNNKWTTYKHISQYHKNGFIVYESEKYYYEYEWIKQHIPKDEWNETYNDMDELGLLESNTYNDKNLKSGDKVKINKNILSLDREKILIDKWVTIEETYALCFSIYEMFHVDYYYDDIIDYTPKEEWDEYLELGLL